jgi:hypothetical protein
MGSSNSSGQLDRPTLEKQWANQEALMKLSKEDRALWSTSRYTFRPFVYFDKIMVVWTVIKGQPQIKEVLKVVGIEASFQDGIWLRMQAEVAKREIMINHSPRRILPGLDVIAWVPYFNELRFVGPDWDDPSTKRNLRLHACFKMRTRGDVDPGSVIAEGHDFISELHVFREQFPQYASTRF